MIQIKTAFKAPGEIFPLEKEYFYEALDFQGAVEFIGPVRFCGSFSCVGQSIEVTGEIRAKLRAYVQSVQRAVRACALSSLQRNLFA